MPKIWYNQYMRLLLKRGKVLILLIFLAFFAYKAYAFFSEEEKVLEYARINKNITVDDNGFRFAVNTDTDTVENFLSKNRIKISEHDRVWPEKETRLLPGASIMIKRAVPITITADGKEIENHTLAKNIAGVLAENGVALGRLDKVEPEKLSPPRKDLKIVVTRINVEEITEEEDIDFKTIAKEDKDLGWREKKIKTPGEKGVREIVYKVTYRNGKEISRVALSKKVTKDPVAQVETQGTYMKLKKAAKGQATWYAYRGGMFAASTTIPKGGFAKVTSTTSGKSIIVQINDYGPQGKGRIIDLDKVAFQKLASLGAGVIGVKVEEILN